MVTCAQCGEVMTDIVDGDTSSTLAREVLEQCAQRERCRRCLDGYRKTAALCRATGPSVLLSATDSERLLALLRAKLAGDK
jgi:hypothetical protein